MAEFCLQKGRLVDAETYAMRLQDFGGPAKDKGRKVIDEVQQAKCVRAASADAAVGT
jgi:hypothetical protein